MMTTNYWKVVFMCVLCFLIYIQMYIHVYSNNQYVNSPLKGAKEKNVTNRTSVQSVTNKPAGKSRIDTDIGKDVHRKTTSNIDVINEVYKAKEEEVKTRGNERSHKLGGSNRQGTKTGMTHIRKVVFNNQLHKAKEKTIIQSENIKTNTNMSVIRNTLGTEKGLEKRDCLAQKDMMNQNSECITKETAIKEEGNLRPIFDINKKDGSKKTHLRNENKSKQMSNIDRLYTSNEIYTTKETGKTKKKGRRVKAHNKQSKTQSNGHINSQSEKLKENRAENLRNTSKMKNWDIIYDEIKLRSELQRIHADLYRPKSRDTCTHKNPDCIIVGVAKCGTRELSDFASMHPNLVPKVDPYKISSDWFETNKLRSQLKTRMPCTYSDQIGMIKQDNFFTDINKPRQIYNLNPHVKIVVLVREPVERIESQLSFRMLKHTLNNSSSQGQTERVFVGRHGFKRKGALSLSTYDKGMKRYLKFFKREQILVIEAKEFISDPVKVLVRLETFLGVQHIFSEKYFVYNADKKFYCLRRLHSSSNGMVCYGDNRGRVKKQKKDEKTREKLRKYFKLHNERFFALIGRRYNW